MTCEHVWKTVERQGRWLSACEKCEKLRCPACGEPCDALISCGEFGDKERCIECEGRAVEAVLAIL
jgi:hypothetical protein